MKKRQGMRRVLYSCLLAAVAAMALTFAAHAAEQVLNVYPGENITSKFNKAAKAARSDPGHTTIVIPPGIYSVDQLKIYGNTTLSMQGVTLVNADSTHSMLRLGAKKADWDQYDNGAGRKGYSPDFSDIHFIGGTWDGNNYPVCIMQMGHAQNLSFEGVTFQNVNSSHHLEFGGCQNIRILNCRFTGYSGNFGNSYNGEAIQFEILSYRGRSHFAGYHSTTDETPCRNVEISGCTFEGLKRGVGSHTAIANGYFSGFRIHDNVFRNITGYAISMLNYVDSSVYSNNITQCGAGIMCAASMSNHGNFYASSLYSNARGVPMNFNCQIANNTMAIDRGANGAYYNNPNFGIWVFGEKLSRKTGTIPAGDWRVSGVTVSGNSVTMNVAAPGIYLQGTVGVNVSQNTVICNYMVGGKSGVGSGIKISRGENDSVTGNDIHNLNTFGPGQSMIGIYVCNKTRLARIEGNVMENSGSDGIRVKNSSGIVINNNNINIHGGYGIRASRKQLMQEIGNVISGGRKKQRSWKKK